MGDFNINHIYVLTITCFDQSNLVKSLGRGIFDGDGNLYNPYTPTNPEQFELPLTIKDGATDEHGQLLADRLDEIFDYKPVGSIGSGEKVTDTSNTPKLSNELMEFLSKAYFADQQIDDLISAFEECKDDADDGISKFCEAGEYDHRFLSDIYYLTY